jgi:hypothetical protein
MPTKKADDSRLASLALLTGRPCHGLFLFGLLS